MSRFENFGQDLAKIHLTLKIHEKYVEDLMEEILEVGKSLNLEPERRAEGYALTPSHRAAAIGLPHLRIAITENLITVWVRSPYALDEEKCRLVGIDAEELYRRLLTGAIKMAEILRKYSEKGEYIQISLP